jgi:hypothetical protein
MDYLAFRSGRLESLSRGVFFCPMEVACGGEIRGGRGGACGEAFERTRAHQRYCKPSCRKAAFTDGRRSQRCRCPIRMTCFSCRLSEPLFQRGIRRMRKSWSPHEVVVATLLLVAAVVALLVVVGGGQWRSAGEGSV